MSKLCCLWKFVLMWSVVMTSWQRWTLARLRCEWSIVVASWQKWSVDVASCQRWMMTWLRYEWSVDMALWQRWMLKRLQCKWWYDFNASTSANVECCRGFMTMMNIGTASVQMNCWHSFMASVRMKCWTLARPQCKYWCNFNASASANVECCYGFMTKMNVGTASMLM